MTINLADYALALDIWQGNGDINESILQANGVEALLIRMNDSAGQLRYDTNFLTQWAQAKAFKRVAYIVVSPLNIGHTFTAAEVVAWILAWRPVDCNIIALDVEIDARVIYNNQTITPAYYSKFVTAIFAGLHAAGITCIQYSGSWFYLMVQPWVKPDYVFQWWARYLNSIQPAVTKDANGNNIYPMISWDGLKAKIAALDWTPLSLGYVETMTGHISIWQISSVWVLPGCQPNDPVDVNIIPRAEFDRIFGTGAVVVPPVLTLQTLDVRVRRLEALDGLAQGG